MNSPSLRRETRYGTPAADQTMFNRHYVLGYSYYFRQAKWALEIVDPDTTSLDRLDSFRPDYRIPDIFRAGLVDYARSGFDSGHLVVSANQIETELQNSDTFLLSNMSPQEPKFRKNIWRELEFEIRKLNQKPKILVTYVICGPIFYFDQPVKVIGTNDPNTVTIPIPHAYFKSVLAENNKGLLQMWSFILPNEDSNKSLNTFSVPTTRIEQFAGIKLWERLVGKNIDREKSRVRKMW